MLWRFAQGAMQAYSFIEGVEAQQRAREQEARAQESIKESRRVQQYVENPEASNKLGAGRLGDLTDAKIENMLDPNGLFLGAMENQPLFYNGDMHLLNYGMTRSGKGRDIILPNLAHVFNRSLVVNDIKDGENAYASAEHRKSNGHRIIALNPYGLLDAPSFKLNPFQRIIDKAQLGHSVTEDALQLCMSLVPPSEGKDKWVAAGAQQVMAIWLEWAARYRPDRCTLAEMWAFIFKDLIPTVETIMDCGDEGLAGLANKIIDIHESTDQWNAYESELTTALWNFRPGTPLAEITASSNFDPADMRHELTTLYLIGSSDRLEACSGWVSLTISAIVNACAQESGPIPVTVMIDELANLPYMAVIPKALTLYAGKGVQLWGLCQGRAALKAKGYSGHTISNFESQSGILHMWLITEPDLLRDVETWSGKTTVATRGVNKSGGQVESASFGISEHARPVLQSEDIMAIGEGKQIIRTGKIGGTRLYIVDRTPWYEVPRWKEALKDVREVHFGKG
ncbi:MAG: type IV secretory system conjugative DNA transfer family protein [Pseudomonadota bacterium]